MHILSPKLDLDHISPLKHILFLKCQCNSINMGTSHVKHGAAHIQENIDKLQWYPRAHHDS